MLNHPGLEWVSTIWGTESRWTKEPSLDIVQKIASHHLYLSSSDSSAATVEFLYQGGFNRLYKVFCTHGTFALRVSLPIDPLFKTLSETAVLDQVGKYTTTAVPKVIAFDASTTTNWDSNGSSWNSCLDLCSETAGLPYVVREM